MKEFSFHTQKKIMEFGRIMNQDKNHVLIKSHVSVVGKITNPWNFTPSMDETPKNPRVFGEEQKCHQYSAQLECKLSKRFLSFPDRNFTFLSAYSLSPLGQNIHFWIEMEQFRVQFGSPDTVCEADGVDAEGRVENLQRLRPGWNWVITSGFRERVRGGVEMLRRHIARGWRFWPKCSLSASVYR